MAVPAARRREFEALARSAGVELESSPASSVLSWALETFGDQFCIAASLTDAVLIDMASRIRPSVNVIFIDTGYHFAETLDTRVRVQAKYPILLRSIEPVQTTFEQDQTFGPCLHDRDPDACCNLRKVEPLRRGLDPYHAWASGIRRDETDARRRIGVVEWDPNRNMVKVNPLANWTASDVDAYAAANDVVVNPLLRNGYPSIGCSPCTQRVDAGADPRSGRWVGQAKSECGLHLDPPRDSE